MMTDYQAEAYLETRARNEGIEVSDLMDMTPTSVSDNAVESATFWQQRDYSHKQAVSLYPELADDPENAMPEDPSTNRARGNDTMSYSEELQAQFDNEVLAAEIDANYTGDDYTYAFEDSPFYFF